MREFSKSDKREGFRRSAGHCEACTAKLSPGNIEYDHIIPYAISRDSGLSNMMVLCRNCHGNKSYAIFIPLIAKLKRIADSHVSIRRFSSRPMPAGRSSGFKKTMRNGVVSRFNMGQMLRKMGLVK